MVNYNGGKMNIKRLIPLKIKQKIIQYISRNDIYKDYKKKDKKIVLALAADYGNLGDVAITYAQRKFLEEKFPNYEVIEIPIASNSRFKSIINRAFSKLPPFEGKDKKSDKGFKDALLWESVLEFALKHPKSKIIYFIILTLFENGHKGTDNS